LACRKINGIGPKADARLQAHGIHTIGQLAACEPQWLMTHFGPTYGAWLHEAANGEDARPVVTESEPVSMSRETTFEKDLHVQHNKDELGAIFTRLCQQVAADLQRKGYVGKSIGVKIRFDNFKSVTRDSTLGFYTSDAKAIRQAAGLCLKRIEFKRRIRLLGVRVGSLVKVDSPQALQPSPGSSLSSTPATHHDPLLKAPAHEQADLF
jgi:DNA polymerase-4